MKCFPVCIRGSYGAGEPDVRRPGNVSGVCPEWSEAARRIAFKRITDEKGMHREGAGTPVIRLTGRAARRPAAWDSSLAEHS